MSKVNKEKEKKKLWLYLQFSLLHTLLCVGIEIFRAFYLLIWLVRQFRAFGLGTSLPDKTCVLHNFCEVTKMFKKNFTREFFNDSDLIECYLDYVRIRFVRGRFYFATFHFRSRAYYLIFFLAGNIFKNDIWQCLPRFLGHNAFSSAKKGYNKL